MSADGERQMVALDALHPMPGNPRRGNVDAIARALDRWGQRRPIVATRTGMIEAGEHTWRAAGALGWAEVWVVYVDDDDATARAYALADNRLADLGDYDPDALADALALVAVDADALAAAGYDPADLEPYTAGGRGTTTAPAPTPAERWDDYDASPTRSFILTWTASEWTDVERDLDALRSDDEAPATTVARVLRAAGEEAT